MFGIGPRRSRSSRTVAFRNQGSLWSRLSAAAQDRGVLLRLAICLLGVIGLLVASESWRAPFPFREGDRPPHGIAAKVDFRRLDDVASERARAAAEAQAPFIFRNRPELLDPLPQQLRSALGEISQANSPDDLSEPTRAAFGLDPLPESSDEDPLPFRSEAPEERFAKLKQAVSMADAQTGQQRIDDIIDDFTKFITPLRQIGVVDLSEIREKELNEGSRLHIKTPWAEEASQDLFLPQVRLETRLTDAGDLGKGWLSYPAIPAEIRPALSHWLLVSTPTTMRYDDADTRETKEAASLQIADLYNEYSKGDRLVMPGELINLDKLDLLQAEYSAVESQIGVGSRALRMTVIFVMLLVLAFLQGYYVVWYEPRLAHSLSRLAVYVIVIVIAVAAGRWLSTWARAEVIPLVVTVMVFAIAFNQVLATLTGFTLALILTLSSTMQLDQFVILMSTTATAAVPLKRVASRSTLIKVGFYAGLTYFFTTCSVDIVQSQTFDESLQKQAMLAHALWGAGWCLAAGYVVAGSLPFIESTFGVVTDISLLELSDPSHPLLQELVRRAPGTYNHSIAVASIAEAAAEAIGGNGLLVRVGAYFHDIGKMLKPQYFIENVQTGGESRHKQLAPAMSTLIIIGHVKDGVDLAEQHHLPRALIDFIEQHHGTTLVEYFFHAATKQAEQDPDHERDAEESAFRYPGPRPQTPEAGVLMLSDCVEGASRTLSDPTPKRIETLVHDLTMKRLLDGQFEECSLRLSDIRTIEKSLVKSLIGIYHGRIRYPDGKASEIRTA
jgi:putative nucleotidyltransferase with HDIG domain